MRNDKYMMITMSDTIYDSSRYHSTKESSIFVNILDTTNKLMCESQLSLNVRASNFRINDLLSTHEQMFISKCESSLDELMRSFYDEDVEYYVLDDSVWEDILNKNFKLISIYASNAYRMMGRNNPFSWVLDLYRSFGHIGSFDMGYIFKYFVSNIYHYDQEESIDRCIYNEIFDETALVTVLDEFENLQGTTSVRYLDCVYLNLTSEAY